MQRGIFAILALAVPAILIGLAFYAHGPAYVSFFSEAPYIVHFNAILLLIGEPVFFIAHSTPLIQLQAAAIGLAHTVLSLEDVASFAINRNLALVVATNAILVAGVAVAAVLFAVSMFRAYGWPAAALIASAFLAVPFYGYVVVAYQNPDFALLGLSLLAFALYMRWRDELTDRRAAVLGLICGVGLACKILFAPVVLAFLILSPKRGFLAGLAGGILLGGWPLLLSLDRIGNYFFTPGAGLQRVMSLSVLDGLVLLAKGSPVMAVAALAGVGLIFSGRRADMLARVSAGAILLHLVVISTRPNDFYVLPMIPAAAIVLAETLRLVTARRAIASVAALAVAFVVYLPLTKMDFAYREDFKEYAASLRSEAARRKDCRLIQAYPFVTSEGAILHGLHYVGNLLENAVAAKLPGNTLWWYPHERGFFDIKNKPVTIEPGSCALIIWRSDTPTNHPFKSEPICGGDTGIDCAQMRRFDYQLARIIP